MKYRFYVETTDENGDKTETFLGEGRTKYLSSEVSSGFTGTMLGMYVIGDAKAEFTEFCCRYNPCPSPLLVV